MKQQRMAMIIALSLACSAYGGEAVRLPDPVSFAVSMEVGDLAQAKEWLDAGLDPNFMGSRIGSGLMIAAWEGKIELMELFLSRGADIDRSNANGETALALAAWKGRREAVAWLLERGARLNGPQRSWSALHYAVFAGHKELANALIDRGADIDALSPNGSSVLMMAVYEGHEDLAHRLIDKGVRRSPKNDWGEGALEWAMRFNRLKLARRIADSPEEFKVAASEPREKWGEPKKSLKMSVELDQLLRMREILEARNLSTAGIDNRIAAERARIVRTELKREALPPVAALEITASRKSPQEQSASLVYGQDGKPQGFKVPPATFVGQARMPPKAPVKNF